MTMAAHSGDVALVTGGSSGIGLAFAREYAQRGADVVLVGRQEQALRDAAAGIMRDFGVDALALPGDLALPETPDRLAQELRRQGRTVSQLVNNAGFGVPGNLVDVEWPRHRDTIEVMARAPVKLAHLFLPEMIARGRGSIINVSSLSAMLPPHAGGTLYYPVKSFLLQFSLALREEARPHGVQVTSVCPGFARTDFQAAAGGRVESVAFPKFLWSEPEDIARAGIAAVERGQAICIPGMVNKAIAIAFKLMPGPLGRWIVRS